MTEIYAPAAPGALMRSALISGPGRFRLSRRDCEIYSIQIVSAGDWGKAWLYTGAGRPIWHQPSTFTGSFWLNGGCEDGLIFELHAMNSGLFNINWREQDRKLV